MDGSLDLTPWLNLRDLLSGYLARLGKLALLEREKAWLYDAARSARDRPEPAAHLEALEWAAGQCDDAAKRALHKKFEGALPRKPKAVRRKDDNSLLDVMVELAAYGWLRREHPEGRLEYVPEAQIGTPDLRLRFVDRVVGIECKNIHMSEEVSAAFDAGKMVSGPGGVTGEFRQKVADALLRAHAQLEGFQEKMIFLNYTPDPDLSVAEEVQGNEVEAVFKSQVPADTELVVFRNYEWARPRYVFAARAREPT